MEHGYHKYRPLAANNDGVSFIELIVSIVLIAVITSPLLHGFMVTVNLNLKAGRQQQQMEEAQNMMEEIKLYTVEDIARLFNYPEDGQAVYEVKPDGVHGFVKVAEAEQSCIRTELSDANGTYYIYEFKEKLNRPYYFAMENIISGNECYDCIITIDGTAYKGKDLSGNPVGHNTIRMPMLCDISRSDHAVAVQTYEAELAVSALYANHIYYCMEQEKLHKDDEVPFSITYHTMEEIREQLENSIRIIISKPSGDMMAEVNMEFSCSAYDGCGSAVFSILPSGILPEDGSIYVFYYPSAIEHVSVNKEPSIPGEIDIFLYEQDTPEAVELSKSIDTLPAGINIYGNVNFPGFISEPVKRDEEKNRIHKVKIQLFQAGREFGPDSLIMELESAKGK